MKKRITILYLWVLSVVVFSLMTSALFSLEEDRQKIFQVNGKVYKLAVQDPSRQNRTDIMLYYEGVEKNLSKDISGENMYPEVEVYEGHFYVSWMNYNRGGESLCFYDSYQDCSLVIVTGGLKHISRNRKIIFTGSFPWALIFKAVSLDNYDLFCYSFITGRMKNITNTPANEKRFHIITNEKNHRVLIETESLYHHYRYRFDPETLEVNLLEKGKVTRKVPDISRESIPGSINRYITYGDSITWGKMRMNNLPYDPSKYYYHPELAYPQKIKEMIEEDYGEGAVDYYNLSNPGDNTGAGVDRLYELDYYRARFFLLMLGTNDAYRRDFFLADSLENLEYIVDTALGYQMGVVISTIPPRNDRMWYEKEWVKPNIQALNAGIIALATLKDIKYIDTYTAFMSYEPPDGWKKLLEDRDASDIYVPGRGGQHPSPLGHLVITENFVPEIKAFLPLLPQNITISNLQENHIYIEWKQNYEFDFSHYNIMFGYFPGRLNRTVTSITSNYTFIRPPYPNPLQPDIYFCIQAVDDSGNKSDFTTIFASTFNNPAPVVSVSSGKSLVIKK